MICTINDDSLMYHRSFIFGMYSNDILTVQFQEQSMLLWPIQSTLYYVHTSLQLVPDAESSCITTIVVTVGEMGLRER